MDKYFLMGLVSVQSFEERGVKGLLDDNFHYVIVKYNERTSLLKDLMDAVIGWDGYVEIFYEDIKEIELEKNARQWREFYKMVDPEDMMSDGEFIDYIAMYYRVPEFIHLDQL
jgi:hypothetical protein